jgi:hypothetical protein
MVPHLNIEHENKNIFPDDGSTLWWGWAVVSCLQFQIPGPQKKERKEETKNLRKLVISNESKAKCGGT